LSTAKSWASFLVTFVSYFSGDHIQISINDYLDSLCLQSLCRDFVEKLETVWLAKGACLLKFMIAFCPENSLFGPL